MLYSKANDHIIPFREVLIIQDLKVCCGMSLEMIKNDLPYYLKNACDFFNLGRCQ